MKFFNKKLASRNIFGLLLLAGTIFVLGLFLKDREKSMVSFALPLFPNIANADVPVPLPEGATASTAEGCCESGSSCG